jgi:hypothetical protein
MVDGKVWKSFGYRPDRWMTIFQMKSSSISRDIMPCATAPEDEVTDDGNCRMGELLCNRGILVAALLRGIEGIHDALRSMRLVAEPGFLL